MTTQNWNFDERNSSQPITFEGSTDKVCEGCTVDLVQNGTTINVQVQGNDGDCWVGEITSFPGETPSRNDSLKVGTTVQFEERHVFRCAA